MKFLVCPQCGINRFFVLNQLGDRMLVQVTRELVIQPIKEGDQLEGYNLDILYCLGCSWRGSKEQLVKYLI